MTTVHDLYTYLDGLYPKALSCAWDNDGLMLCGDGSKEVKRVLCALDVTEKQSRKVMTVSSRITR